MNNAKPKTYNPRACNLTHSTNPGAYIIFSGIGIDIKSPSALCEPLGRILEQHTLPLFDVHGLVEDDLFEILLLNDFDGFVA